jgi:UDP-N-acetylmuramoyl-tripeptide--D-alanyl-D-alanine ligase
MISPRDLADVLGERLQNDPGPLPSVPFHDVVIDSRKVETGDLFVALKGEHTDGHKFIVDALNGGATGILSRLLPESLPDGARAFLADDPLAALQGAAKCWRSRQQARVIGITGSVGKTTTREAVAQVLSHKHAVFQSPRNFNSDIGLPLALLALGPEHDWAVMELGPYDRAEMELLTETARPNIGIVTNVGPTHLERFGSLDATEEIKGLLPARLPGDGIAVLNADDERVRRMADRTSARVLWFGLSADADVRASEVKTDGLEGIRFTLHLANDSAAVQTPLIGSHQVMTALAAAAVATTAGMTIKEIVEALANIEAGSRLKPRRSYSGALLLDDAYNAAPLSMRAALDVLAEMPGNRIAVLGDMLELGSEEDDSHREVGAYAVDRCDRLIAVGTRARGVADGAWDAGHSQIQWFEEQGDATRMLRQEIGGDDVVLVKASYGMHLEEMVEALISAEGTP